jgi:hypothetical protein
LLLAVWFVAVQPSAAQTSVPLGYEVWFATDPACPCSPDAIDHYIVYGYYSEESSSYVVTGMQYAGRSTYRCGNGTVQGTFYYSPYWQACMAYWGGQCPCAGDVMNTGCMIHGQWNNQCGNVE